MKFIFSLHLIILTISFSCLRNFSFLYFIYKIKNDNSLHFLRANLKNNKFEYIRKLMEEDRLKIHLEDKLIDDFINYYNVADSSDFEEIIDPTIFDNLDEIEKIESSNKNTQVYKDERDKKRNKKKYSTNKSCESTEKACNAHIRDNLRTQRRAPKRYLDNEFYYDTSLNIDYKIKCNKNRRNNKRPSNYKRGVDKKTHKDKSHVIKKLSELNMNSKEEKIDNDVFTKFNSPTIDVAHDKAGPSHRK
ncbi:Plasmodium exported protein, unknown function [Plasmodium gallinaceum]|uniref:Uncharacterized protein n=1 Tax=Plasmodium gallinaceum TaxID=5849 RepID=A0A1J1GYB2_PLAGA|nr:Plasmodium exported protein, unknown function [Plasmodium gallinaceum]CRG95992.1 Plasmodium exported protein, unknown function [Plasmodium gallinaceum]